jgi:hypothetical protein
MLKCLHKVGRCQLNKLGRRIVLGASEVDRRQLHCLLWCVRTCGERCELCDALLLEHSVSLADIKRHVTLPVSPSARKWLPNSYDQHSVSLGRKWWRAFIGRVLRLRQPVADRSATALLLLMRLEPAPAGSTAVRLDVYPW